MNVVLSGKMLSRNLILLACTAALASAACSDYKFCEECLNEDCSYAPDAAVCLDSCADIADTTCLAPPDGMLGGVFGDDAEEICGNDLDLTDLMGDLAAGNITDALGSLVGDETEAEVTGMLDGLGDIDFGNMTEADLGGLLGDLGFGNVTDADLGAMLDEHLGHLAGMENMTEAEIASALGGMLGMTVAPTMAPTVLESGSAIKFTTTVAAWAFAGSYMAFALV